MQRFVTLSLTALATVLGAFGSTAAAASTEQVLYSFCSFSSTEPCSDGATPIAGLTFDASGNMYGTTSGGGVGGGVVFEFTPGPNGGYEQRLCAFQLTDRYRYKDGDTPYGGVILDASGDVYGTTSTGGADADVGGGVVFELKYQPSGNYWEQYLVYTFSDGGNQERGSGLFDGVIFDSSGALYGTARSGGHYGNGVVFRLSGNNWGETVLHSFDNNGKDGYSPTASVVLDAAGNVYGTTQYGGTAGSTCPNGCGTVFELSPNEKGGWGETVLYRFKPNGIDGNYPVASLAFDTAGNIYGTTSQGGGSTNCSGGCGTVFELTQATPGHWTEKILHSFKNTDGNFIYGGLTLDASGNVYGTAAEGGNLSDCGGVGCGVVFELSRNAEDQWFMKLLHTFAGADGSYPSAAPIFGSDGNLYGTTQSGGANGKGTIFEITQ
jgi:uncharacterized repeat protein (TIGR03803 family)